MENENIQEKKINKEVSPATVEEVNINDDLYIDLPVSEETTIDLSKTVEEVKRVMSEDKNE